nr:HesA/MoeB/ThiF family protein [Candidatus Woesearchaeota archaeon]
MRYARQESLIDKENQGLLKGKTVAIVGIGAIGTNSANLLARSGINLILIDHDEVDLTNLDRQSLFDEKDVGKLKVKAAKEKLSKINSSIKIKIFKEKLTEKNLDILYSDLVLDCIDNLEARFLINKFCVENKIPWVHAAAIKYSGIVFNFVPGSACFNCIYKNVDNIERCEDVGILNSVVSLISAIQASEALKILLGKNYEKDLIRINLQNNSFDKIKVNKDQNCKICNEEVKDIKKFDIKLCKTKGAYSVKLNKKIDIDFKKLKGYKIIIETPILLVLKVGNEEIVVHKYGEIIFKKLKDEKKIIKIANEILNKF